MPISEHRRQLVAEMRGPLFAMTLIGREEVEEQRRSMSFWADCLEGYTTGDVRRAFRDYAKAGKRFPQPGDIVAIITAYHADEDERTLRQVHEARRQAQMKAAAQEQAK